MKRPKLHLRDLFWLVLVCALILGWSLDHRDKAMSAGAALSCLE